MLFVVATLLFLMNSNFIEIVHDPHRTCITFLEQLLYFARPSMSLHDIREAIMWWHTGTVEKITNEQIKLMFVVVSVVFR